VKRLFFYIIFLINCFNAIQARGQKSQLAHGAHLSNTSSNIVASDSVAKKIDLLQASALKNAPSYLGQNELLSDSTAKKIATLKGSLQQRIDSLKAKGNPADSLQEELDRVKGIAQPPEEKYQRLLSFQHELQGKLRNKVPRSDTLQVLANKLREKTNTIKDVSTELGIGPLGKDLKPDIGASLPSLPTSDDVVVNLKPDVSGMKQPDAPHLAGMPDLNVSVPNPNIKNPAGKLTESPGEVTGKVSEVTDVVTKAGGIAKEASAYGDDIKKVKEDGLAKSEKLPELAEQEALRLDEIKALRAETDKVDQMKAYKDLIEQYKDEKRIKEEMEKKVKELANDVIIQNEGKVGETMKRIAKYKRKFNDVPDIRNLPKRAPNPMKGLDWRERWVPGITLQVVNNRKVWLELDPQVFYKISGNWSAGAGAMYRFSMNPDQITFSDFTSLYGGKVFAEYAAFRGFFLRSELQSVKWKPSGWGITDPESVDKTYVAAAGIGKRYVLAKKIKGSAQTLYHWYWNGLDPYKPKIMIRLGFDFSLMKKKEKPWSKRLKELKAKN
jgi:hypothetical protein